MRIQVEQLHGETLDLEVTAEMTMRPVKEHVKRLHTWEDELSCDSTAVEFFNGDNMVPEKTVEELGLRNASKVTAVFRKNLVKTPMKVLALISMKRL